MTEKTAHKHSFPVQPPRGSWSDPGPCECGKTWARSQAERAIEEAAAAVSDKTPRDETALQLLDANEQLAARVTELESERDEYRDNAILHIRERDEACAERVAADLIAAERARLHDEALARTGALESHLAAAQKRALAADRKRDQHAIRINELESELAEATQTMTELAPLSLKNERDRWEREAERLKRDNGQHTARIRELEAENARLASSARHLGRIVSSQSRATYAAWIDSRRGDHEAAAEWLANSVPDVPDHEPWNGTETGDQWFDRTRQEDS